MEHRFLDLAEVLEIHVDQIERYGGSVGVRDLPLLLSALAMPTTNRAGFGPVSWCSRESARRASPPRSRPAPGASLRGVAGRSQSPYTQCGGAPRHHPQTEAEHCREYRNAARHSFAPAPIPSLGPVMPIPLLEVLGMRVTLAQLNQSPHEVQVFFHLVKVQSRLHDLPARPRVEPRV